MRGLLDMFNSATSHLESVAIEMCRHVPEEWHRWNDVRGVLVFGADEGPDAGESHDEQDEAEGSAYIAETLASYLAGGDAPLGGKEPDAIGKVPADGDHGDDVNGEHERVAEFMLHLLRMRRRDSQEG